MKVSEVLQQAWSLLQQPGGFCQRAAARNAGGEVVHALHESATSFDSVGALQKVLGEMDGEPFTDALNCLRVGAMKVHRSLGVQEINDNGDADQLQAMWVFGMQSAQLVEVQLSPAMA